MNGMFTSIEEHTNNRTLNKLHINTHPLDRPSWFIIILTLVGFISFSSRNPFKLSSVALHGRPPMNTDVAPPPIAEKDLCQTCNYEQQNINPDPFMFPGWIRH